MITLNKLAEEEFKKLIESNPEFIEKLMSFTILTEEKAKERIKKWFYTPNKLLEGYQPIEIYRTSGPEKLYYFFEKPDWSKILP